MQEPTRILTLGCFHCLIDSYLVFRTGWKCYLAPWVVEPFARNALKIRHGAAGTRALHRARPEVVGGMGNLGKRDSGKLLHVVEHRLHDERRGKPAVGSWKTWRQRDKTFFPSSLAQIKKWACAFIPDNVSACATTLGLTTFSTTINETRHSIDCCLPSVVYALLQTNY